MVAGIAATFHAVNYVQRLRAAIARRVQTGGGNTDSLKALDAALVPLDGSSGVFGLAHRDLGRRLTDQLVGDLAPTASVIAGVNTPCAAIDKGLAALRKLDVSSVPDVPAWAPPPAPACGR
jgi:hypothetical protein